MRKWCCGVVVYPHSHFSVHTNTVWDCVDRLTLRQWMVEDMVTNTVYWCYIAIPYWKCPSLCSVRAVDGSCSICFGNVLNTHCCSKITKLSCKNLFLNNTRMVHYMVVQVDVLNLSRARCTSRDVHVGCSVLLTAVHCRNKQ